VLAVLDDVESAVNTNAWRADTPELRRAVDDIGQLVSGARGVLTLHTSIVDGQERCQADYQPWPCPTVKALAGDR
jgi:hypothetical protein